MHLNRRTMLAAAACGSSGPGGPSPAYQKGYKVGHDQANAPAGPYTEPGQYCSTFSIYQTSGYSEKDTQDWNKGCLDGFARKGQS